MRTPAPPVRLLMRRVLGLVGLLVGLGFIASRPLDDRQLRTAGYRSLEPVANAYEDESDKVSYTDASSYSTGPTQGPGD